MYWVYMLRCRDSSLYIGHTNNLLRRVDDHNAGRGARFTAARRPVLVVYTEQAETEAAGIARERQLKGWTRSKKEALIAGDLALLKRL
jgi:predicted GIY-YIG superfamily endonuclease